MTLGGVRVDRAVQVGPGIQLISFEGISTFFWASRIAGLYRTFHKNYQPTAAILQTAAYRKAVRPPGAQMDFPPNMYQSLEDVRRCVTAIGPSCPVWLGTWTELDEWLPTYGSGGNSQPLRDGWLPTKNPRR